MSATAVRSSTFARPLVLVLVALLIRPAVAVANDVTPPAPAPVRAVIKGFVDTHLNQFANLGFGGLEAWGSPMDPTLDASAPDSVPAFDVCLSTPKRGRVFDEIENAAVCDGDPVHWDREVGGCGRAVLKRKWISVCARAVQGE